MYTNHIHSDVTRPSENLEHKHGISWLWFRLQRGRAPRQASFPLFFPNRLKSLYRCVPSLIRPRIHQAWKFLVTQRARLQASIRARAAAVSLIPGSPQLHPTAQQARLDCKNVAKSRRRESRDAAYVGHDAWLGQPNGGRLCLRHGPQQRRRSEAEVSCCYAE